MDDFACRIRIGACLVGAKLLLANAFWLIVSLGKISFGDLVRYEPNCGDLGLISQFKRFRELAVARAEIPVPAKHSSLK